MEAVEVTEAAAVGTAVVTVVDLEVVSEVFFNFFLFILLIN